MIRSLRLATGMLTALPAGAVLDPSPATARGAILLAPLAVAPLGVLAGVVLWLGGVLSLPPLAVALVAVAGLAVGTRALHLDGLSDVADGLTVSHDPDRSLAVMKGGTAGPAGAAALAIVLGLQAAGLAGLVGAGAGDWKHPLAGGCCVAASRFALWITCCSQFRSARPDGLGATFVGRVPLALAAFAFGALALASSVVSSVRAPVTIGVAAIVTVLLTRHCARRFGGVTGDVFGAAIEVAFAVLVVGAATIPV